MNKYHFIEEGYIPVKYIILEKINHNYYRRLEIKNLESGSGNGGKLYGGNEFYLKILET